MPNSRRTSDELATMRAHVRELADAQGGVFRRSDLQMWGYEPTLVLTMRRNGMWVRLHHGVYVDRQTLDAARTPAAVHLLRAAAALAALPADVALFGPTAGLNFVLPVERAIIGDVELVRPHGHDSRALRRRISARDHLPPATIHVLGIPDEMLTVHAGLATVNRDLAAWSTALASSPDWAVAALDAVAWEDEDALGRLAAISELWPSLHGHGTARAALALARTGAQTVLESISRVRLMRCGLPEPRLQVPLYDDDGLIGYVDMLFDELGVVGEADGLAKYATRQDVIKEKRREDRIRAKGLGMVRWEWTHAMTDMRMVAEWLWAAARLNRRRWSA